MNYQNLAFTDNIKKLQTENGSRIAYERREKFAYRDGLTAAEMEFIQQRDSFYVASIGENGYPYIQHRGGPKGFLKVLDDNRLAFLDFMGNKQYITVGNVGSNPNVSLFLMDYPNQTRLKMYAQAEVVALADQAELIETLSLPDYRYRPERAIVFHVKAYDWNCPQHITPRYTEDEVKAVLEQQQDYIAKLEAELSEFRSK